MFYKHLNSQVNRRNLLVAAAMTVLAGCTVIPKGPAPTTPAPTPSESVIPVDTERHRIALLVPISGRNSAVGQSIANAANMALLDTGATNLRVTTYDTATDPRDAAQRAIADGNKLILGPLLADNIPAIASVARPAKIPLISFSNDEAAASRDVFIMGNLPGQSIARTVEYAHAHGISAFAALVPRGEYGDRASDALLSSVRSSGGAVIAMEPYDRTAASISAAATRMKAKTGYGALLIADGGSLSAKAATAFRTGDGNANVRLLGTELWGGEHELAATPALAGAWFSTVSDQRFGQFSKSYRSRFGGQPFRIATLGYDAVLLTLRVARDWKPGKTFPTAQMLESGGFLGLDGPFRFTRGGIVERSLEVREVERGSIKVVSPAPTKFDN
ncbi:penicillin-binding protein activator [Novosphingobium mangrovi (ex Huang et al. 2023)]|uniref:Penicillin-binding protein activator n=1 Tax=Novosphingobium mangrovi (ex Huang et al. 2023) TaxID=2976432 RepID=A0ABT2I456_9SPHN|nr:penicillin-binding protein activator [Novosphingobium mangrovi (ex Huang et al. 2023)]MCT2399591.1 penicillin-binding protein activator [Novosphingobium mangrovi (ex Huang et al. 2023)]